MSTQTILIIALCSGLNVALGGIIYLMKLPLYLDMVGTILCALLFANNPYKAFLAASIAGVLSFLVGGVFNPYLPWFSLTVIAVAAVTAFITGRSFRDNHAISGSKMLLRVLGYGVLTGIVAAIVSAPVVVYLFGGVTGSGTAMLVAFFLKAGNQLLNAALLSGLSAEPVDKTIQLLLAVLLLRATPASVIERIRASR